MHIRVNGHFFVIENVKGLLTLSNGAFRDDIVSRFENLGYSVVYKVVNAADFGIPQKRERVFFVGLKNGMFSFPAPFDYKVTCAEALSDLPELTAANGDDTSHQYACAPQNEYQKIMRRNSNIVFNHQWTAHSEQTKHIISMIPDGGKIRDLPREYWEIRKYNKAFERMGSTRQSNTVDTGHRNYFHYSADRIPTVRENCRLQSFADDFVILGSKTSQYKQVGNAVPPLLAYAIARAIMEQLQ